MFKLYFLYAVLPDFFSLYKFSSPLSILETTFFDLHLAHVLQILFFFDFLTLPTARVKFVGIIGQF